MPVVTCDLFSALLDSRSGGTDALASISEGRDWSVPPQAVYDRWDAANKALQRDCGSWVPFVELSRRALESTYAELGLTGDPDADVARLLGSVALWPLWPDVGSALDALGAVARVGVLSNVDTAVFHATQVAPLVDPALVMTSEGLRAYKPRPELYERARAELGPFVHVATSARDVRGALEAGIAVVRLARPGHALDPAGPAPVHEVASLSQLPGVLESVAPR